MPVVSKRKPYRVGRSRTGLGLFATSDIEKGTRIVEYFGPMLDCSKPKDDAIENKYLFELNGRWTIDGSVRRNVARYANHSCRPNAESDVHPRLKKVYIRSIKKIRAGDEITYDYGTDYFREYLKPIGCLCVSCVAKRKAARAEERAKKKRARARKAKRVLNGASGHANGHAAAAKKSRRTTGAARH
jgi:SET domain-containing protein